jgi:hypothetical protein
MKGNDAFLIVEYNAYVKPPESNLFHPSPYIEQQNVKFNMSSEKCEKIVASEARNSPYDGIVQLFVDIDGEQAISISETRSGWNKWIAIVYSFRVKCDNADHKISIRVNQWVSEILGQFGRWQEIYRETQTLKFEKPSP